MIDYANTRRGDILKIVGAGAPGYAKLGDLVRVTKVETNRVTVEDGRGETVDFLYNCGAARLEPTEWRDDFPSDEAVKAQAALTWRDIAEAAYRAYCVNMTSVTPDATNWADLPGCARNGWEAAVRHASDFRRNPSFARRCERDWAGWVSPCPPPDPPTCEASVAHDLTSRPPGDPSMTRCKFQCESITPSQPDNPDNPGRVIKLRAFYCPEVPEDQAFTKYTPAGEFRAQIENPAAVAMFEVGKFYYLDLSPVPE